MSPKRSTTEKSAAQPTPGAAETSEQRGGDDSLRQDPAQYAEALGGMWDEEYDLNGDESEECEDEEKDGKQVRKPMASSIGSLHRRRKDRMAKLVKAPSSGTARQPIQEELSQIATATGGFSRPPSLMSPDQRASMAESTWSVDTAGTGGSSALQGIADVEEQFIRYGPSGAQRKVSLRMPINPETGRPLSVKSMVASEGVVTPTSTWFSCEVGNEGRPRASTDTHIESIQEESDYEEEEEGDDGTGGDKAPEVPLNFGGKPALSPFEMSFERFGFEGDSGDDKKS